jgi:hypothetical protein
LPKNKLLKLVALIAVIGLLSTSMVVKPASALVAQNVTSWYWTSDTNVSSVAVGDVNGDGKNEIVTGGWYNDGYRWVAQLVVWNASNLAVENVKTWYWMADTQISSVAVGDVNGDGKNEIVTGGSYFDGNRWIAQLVVWEGATLAVVGVTAWYWISDTAISSVAVANITGGAGLSIVTGGSYFDGTRWIAQLVVWNGATLAVQKVKAWYWSSNTYINSVAVANITGGPSLSIVTGGSYNDGTRYVSQLVVWNASNLALNNVASWYWTSDTEITSVGVANVTGGSALSIVTGGTYFDGTRYNAQLVEWNGSTLALQNVVAWYWYSNTKITSIAVANYTGGSSLDIITGGAYNDGVRNCAQLVDWNGASFAVQSVATWYQTSNTMANSVAVGNIGSGNRIIVGGEYFDLVRENAQLMIWG